MNVAFMDAAQTVVGATYTPPPAPTPTYTAPTPEPGYPPTEVLQHTGEGCGCGGSCGSAASKVDFTGAAGSSGSPSTGVALMPPRFMLMNQLQTPADFKPTPLVQEDNMPFDFSNWRTDWWKYVAGALAYKLLSK